MPRYDYHCPANGRTVEVEHGWSARLTTWAQVCEAAGIDPGETQPAAPVARLVGLPRILRTTPDEGHGGGPVGEQEGSAPSPGGRAGLHPVGCQCCLPELTPSMKLFHEKLSRSLRGSEKPDHDDDAP